MHMYATTALVCFLLLCPGVLLESPSHSISSSTIPLFMWSNKQITKSSTEIVDTVNPEAIESTLLSLLNLRKNKVDSALGRALNGLETAPEAIVLFVEPELRTDLVSRFGSAFSVNTNGGSFSGLNSLIQKSTWSVTAPYTSMGGQFSLLQSTVTRISDSFTNILVIRENESSLFDLLRKLSGVNTIPSEDAKAYLEARKAQFQDGVTDLIIVSLDKAGNRDQMAATLKSHDELISQISAVVSELTSGDYVAIYSADAPSPSEIQWTFPRSSAESGVSSIPTDTHSRVASAARKIAAQPTHAIPAHMLAPAEVDLTGSLFTPPGLVAFGMVFDDSNTTGNGTAPIPVPGKGSMYFPGGFIEFLLISGILLTMIFVGGCALFGLQTPDRWEAPKYRREVL